MRIGYAEDIHKLTSGRDLVLGGVKIPFEKGLEGHSDADVIYHAVVESIFGALAIGDLGKHFPDSDSKYLNIDSSFFMNEALKEMNKKSASIENLDVSVICEQPKLSSYIEQMRENISRLLNCDKDVVSVKACTNEGLGEIGEGKAIKAVCVCLLK